MYFYTAKAQAKFQAHPELIKTVQLRQPEEVSQAEQQEFDHRLDLAIGKSDMLSEEAHDQLAAPCIAPAELTPSECAESANAEAWMKGYRETDQINRDWLDRNQKLYEETMAVIDDSEALGIDFNGIDIESSPPTCSGPVLPVNEVAKNWFAGTSNFREIADDEFEAAMPTERGLLQTLARPQTAGAASGQGAITRRDSFLESKSIRSGSEPSILVSTTGKLATLRKRRTLPTPERRSLLAFQATFKW
jgi:hypothetical protein